MAVGCTDGVLGAVVVGMTRTHRSRCPATALCYLEVVPREEEAARWEAVPLAAPVSVSLRPAHWESGEVEEVCLS